MQEVFQRILVSDWLDLLKTTDAEHGFKKVQH